MTELLTLHKINQKIIVYKKCTRLSTYIKKVSKEKVRRFKDEDYWGKPLPGFGDSKAELLIMGLAPNLTEVIVLDECLQEIVQVIGWQEYYMRMDLLHHFTARKEAMVLS